MQALTCRSWLGGHVPFKAGVMSSLNREIRQKRERMAGWPACSPR